MVGLLGLINSTLNILSIFSLIGTNTVVLRLLPEVEAKNSLAASREVQIRIYRIVLFLSPMISIITLGVAYFFETVNPTELSRLPVFFIAAATLPLFSLARLSTETLRAQHHTKLYALAHMLPALTNFGFLIIFMFLFQMGQAPVLALISSLLLVFMVTFSLAFRKSIRRRLRYIDMTLPGSIAILKLSLPMGFSMGMQMLMANLDLLLIGLLRTNQEAGVYNIVSKLAVLTSFIITSINAVSASKFSHLYYSDQLTDLLMLAKKSSRFIFWASLPILLILLIFGKFILSIFGSEFTTGYYVLVILVCAEFINAMGGSVGLFLNMTGSHIQYRNFITSAAIVNAILNLLLIPRIGIIGAGIASLLSVTIFNMTASYYIYRQTGTIISYIPDFIRRKI